MWRKILVISFLIALVLVFFQLHKNTPFYPTTESNSYYILDATSIGEPWTLTDFYVGKFDIKDLGFKGAYVYNEYPGPKYKKQLDFLDTPIVIVKDGEYWDRHCFTKWKDKAPKLPKDKLTPIIPEDINIEYKWMPVNLYINEEWDGQVFLENKLWVNLHHQITGHDKNIWYVSTVANYNKKSSKVTAYYFETFEDSTLISSVMTDDKHEVIGRVNLIPENK